MAKIAKGKLIWMKRHPVWTSILLFLIVCYILSIMAGPWPEEEVILTDDLVKELCYDLNSYYDYCFLRKTASTCNHEVFDKLETEYKLSLKQIINISDCWPN